MWSLFKNTFILFRWANTLYSLIDVCTGKLLPGQINIPRNVMVTVSGDYIYLYLAGFNEKVVRINTTKATPQNVGSVIEAIVNNKKIDIEDVIEEVTINSEVLVDEYNNILFFNPYKMEAVGFIATGNDDVETFMPIVNNYLDEKKAQYAGTDATCVVDFQSGTVSFKLNNETSSFEIITIYNNKLPALPEIEIPAGYKLVNKYPGLFGGSITCVMNNSLILVAKDGSFRDVDPERFQCTYSDGMYFIIDNYDHCKKETIASAAFSVKVPPFILLTYELVV